MEVELSYLNDKIDMVNSNIHLLVAVLGIFLGVAGAAGVSFYGIAKKIARETVEKELPKLVRTMPQIEKVSGKLDIISSYNNQFNRARIGSINISGTSINSLEDLLSVSIYYYSQDDPSSIEMKNQSYSSSDMNILMNLRYKVYINKYSSKILQNEIVFYIDQDDVPLDIFYEIVYRRY